ncbi:FMN-binding negative transcriptional regulator [Rhodobacterales bacterium HKCCE3408]|nr:FMN-binding negative transcriptional regulator [Rhodobacterales bacterium HKCCE3408]
MHPNPAFRNEPAILHMTLVRTRGFGTLCVNADPSPLLSHIPFILDDMGEELELHLVRSNPIARMALPAPAVISVSGPDGYVSPDWYGDPTHNQVPTWNYVAVHLRGTLEAVPDGDLRGHLDRLAESFETRISHKRPWTSDKMPAGRMEALMRAIVLFRFRIESVEGTWKLNQNKDEAHRENAAVQIRHSPIGHETTVLSELMMGGHHAGFEF